MPDPSPVLQSVAAYRAQLEAQDTKALSRLVGNYLGSWKRLEALLNSLLLDIGTNRPTRGQLVRMQRYKSLMEQITQELAGLQTLTGNEIEAAGALGIKLGGLHARELISTTIADSPGLAASFNVLPKGAIEMLLGFLAPEGPLYERLRLLAPTVTSAVAQAILEGVTLGFNPRKIAAIVQGAFGRGLTDALRFVRTAQLWSYREANRATFVANGDLLDGWIWHSALDDRTCMSCIAMHGTVHPVTETLNDHHNGRAEMPGNLILTDNASAFETLDYKGDVVVIRTASGKFLAVTPNHPVLTRRGWIAAAFIKEGDDVISDNRGELAPLGMSPDKHEVPTCVEQIPGSFDMLRLGRVPEASKYLDANNGPDGQVDVVYINRFLWDGFDSSLKKYIRQQFFGGRNAISGRLFGFSGFTQTFGRGRLTSDRVLGIFNACLPLFGSHCLETNGIGLRKCMALDTAIAQDTGYNTPRDIELFGQSHFGMIGKVKGNNLIRRQSDFIPTISGNFPAFDCATFGGVPEQPASLESIREGLLRSMPAGSSNFNAITGQVVFDRVVDVGIRTFTGHVYSLQTQQEWYYSNGIISHNCAMVPLVKGFDNPVDEMGTDWFEQQPASTQMSMMGKGKYQAWRSGKFQLSQLTTEHTDDVYGPMRIEQSLKKLLAAQN